MDLFDLDEFESREGEFASFPAVDSRERAARSKLVGKDLADELRFLDRVRAELDVLSGMYGD